MAVLAALMLTPCLGHGAPMTSDAGEIQPVLSVPLDDRRETRLTSVVVSYPPGGRSRQHHHGGSVFAFVLSGTIRSRNSRTGATRLYRTGEALFEPFPSEHLLSENASSRVSARMLVVFVARDGAALTTFDDRR